MRDEPYKGLVTKYAIYPWSPDESGAECQRLRAMKIEYAQDEEGRIWRRIKREKPGPHWTKYSELTRWHVADMYAWFPGESPSTFAGARRQNTRARPPKKLDVYLIDDRPAVFLRPDFEFSR